MDLTKQLRAKPTSFEPKPFSPGQQVGLREVESSTVAGSARGPRAAYRFGEAEAPAMPHDNGHLQNPKDAHDDQPMDTVEATPSDYLQLAKWHTFLQGSELIRGDMTDANAAYRHFLEGDGADRTVPFERYLREDASGVRTLDSATKDTQRGAQEQYAKLLAKDPALADETVTFEMTGTAISAGDTAAYPYPDTENWQKTIGGFSLWTSADVTVTPTENGPKYELQMTLHAEDRYNFDPSKKDVASGIKDEENGRFEQTGLAQQYTNRGEASRRIEWTGDADTAVATSSHYTARERPAQDDRRALNRM